MEAKVDSWQVQVMANGEPVLTIGDNFLSGVENIDEYTPLVKSCAEHLRGFAGGKATTEEFLKECDISQLEYVRQRALALIEAKQAEDKIPLWVVSDEDMNYAAFPADQYTEAVKRLLAEIQKEAESHPGLELRFELLKIRYRQSEVGDMLALT